MALLNSKHGYGALTKLFHWLIVALFAFQYVAAAIMLRIEGQQAVLGWKQGDYYNWHKTIGLVALAIAIMRLLNRRAGRLPPWASTLSEGEKRFIHRAEQILYTAMFIMPVSGLVYVMAHGYGVLLFGSYPLPNPIGSWPMLGSIAKWTHIIASYILALTILGHLGLVLRHQLLLKDGLLWRMLPGRPPGKE